MGDPFTNNSICCACSNPVTGWGVIGSGINHQKEDRLPRFLCVGCFIVDRDMSFPRVAVQRDSTGEWTYALITPVELLESIRRALQCNSV